MSYEPYQALGEAKAEDYSPDVLVASTHDPGDDLLRAAPLLVVEVTSPSTSSDDWGRKLAAYGRGGAHWYWIADPGARQVTLFRNEGGTLALDRELRPGRHRLRQPFPVTVDVAAAFL